MEIIIIILSIWLLTAVAYIIAYRKPHVCTVHTLEAVDGDYNRCAAYCERGHHMGIMIYRNGPLFHVNYGNDVERMVNGFNNAYVQRATYDHFSVKPEMYNG